MLDSVTSLSRTWFATPCKVLIYWLVASASGVVVAQPTPTGLANGSMEALEDEVPQGWFFVKRPEGEQELVIDEESPFAGERAVLLDCSSDANQFTNLMQVVGADEFQGQRVRFRAAVRTSDLAANTRVQLWFRVDREGDKPGAFDNMQDRPIDSESWQLFDIVLDVAEDADDLNVGMFVIGEGKAWIDGATLEVVDDETETTSSNSSELFEAAEASPPQPFFNNWLWLAALAMLLFGISQRTPRAPDDMDDVDPEDWDLNDPERYPPLGWVTKFALRFSVAYWLLYSLPVPLVGLAPKFSQPVFTAYASWSDAVVRWTGLHILGIEWELIPPAGSGDTTYSYINLLVCFGLASAVATIWTAVDWRTTNYRITKDLLRSYLRYVLAVTMIGYGLAKTGNVTNQFPEPASFRLEQPFGEASPMGLLWTFMGASRAYTRFGGLCEVLGGILLLWRRTTTVGAMVVFGVMLNVVMLNFCYDVPVKQYSVHLAVMAMYLLLPEVKRLLNLMVLNRPTASVDFRPPYVGPSTIWVQRIVKLILVVMLAIIPIWKHIAAEVENSDAAVANADAKTGSLLMDRGFHWINEIPFNR